MLAYEDQAGALNSTTQTIAGKNGQIVDDQDYVELVKKNKSYGITTNLSVNYKSFSLLAQIATSWGGYNSMDRVKQGTASTNASWSQVTYLTDMYDSYDNPMVNIRICSFMTMLIKHLISGPYLLSGLWFVH